MSGEIPDGRVVALCGGVGGAKLAFGLSRLLADRLSVVVNTGDDFEHLGLHISPDVDTVLYTLAELSDRERGWGRASETWAFMESLRELGGEGWFNLGDRDLALHVLRTQALQAGDGLTTFTAGMARRMGIASAVLPMSDMPVRTEVMTDIGRLPFQRYFVEHQCRPVVRGIAFDGADRALLTDEVRQAFEAPDLGAIVICPSNPFLSVDPLLAIPELRDRLASRRVPCIAVSPLIGGKAVKGPTAKIMEELGLQVTNAAIARHYDGLIDALVVDHGDAAGPREGLELLAVPTLMTTDEDRVRLASEVLSLAGRPR